MKDRVSTEWSASTLVLRGESRECFLKGNIDNQS